MTAFGRASEQPRPRRSAGASVHVVLIMCPLLSVRIPARATGIDGVQLVWNGTL
jgi:hypothetical protein